MSCLTDLVCVTASKALEAQADHRVSEFVKMSHDAQRQFLDSRENQAESDRLIRILFNIVAKISSDAPLVKWALAMINGILEDDRSRVKQMAKLQKSFNKEIQVDCINILMSYLTQNSATQNRCERDLAAHTLAQLIAYAGIDKNQEAASNFLVYLLSAKDQPGRLSR